MKVALEARVDLCRGEEPQTLRCVPDSLHGKRMMDEKPVCC